jgi:DNA polymerase-3 subunit delta'
MSSLDPALQQSLRRGRLGHAYLFIGPNRGDLEMCARALAKALNCEKNDAPSEKFCGKCDACARIDAENHPDVRWIRPESKSRRITVDEIRAFERAVNLKSSTARVKIGVIVDADCMVESAANAFLKTLEEPPPQSLILLLTRSPERLLATIVSRCLKINFGASKSREFSARQQKIAEILAKFLQKNMPPVVAAYGFWRHVQQVLSEIRAEKQAESEKSLEKLEQFELDSAARKRFEDEAAARAQSEYLREREEILQAMLWFFRDLWVKEDGQKAESALETVEDLAADLARGVSEPLAFEVAFLRIFGR